MKKILLVLCLFLTGCALRRSEPVQNHFDFRIAVIDDGAAGSEVTYYDDNYQELGRTKLDNRFVNTADSVFNTVVTHDGYAYIAPARGRGNTSELIRLDLSSGSVDYVPVEIFNTEAMLGDDEKLVLIQAGRNGMPYYRSEIPYDGSEGKVTKFKDGELPGLYFRIPSGWLRYRNAFDCRITQYDPQFSQTDEVIVGKNYNPNDGGFEENNPWNSYRNESVYLNGALFIPVRRELVSWQMNNENTYERGPYEGMEGGLMKIQTDPLRWEVYGDKDIVYSDIEALDETRILMIAARQEKSESTINGETHTIFEYTPGYLMIHSIETGEFNEFKTDWKPQSLMKDTEVLYVTDTELKIHVLDPESLQELKVIEHVSTYPAQMAQIISSKPCR